jgi:hypothetical protein
MSARVDTRFASALAPRSSSIRTLASSVRTAAVSAAARSPGARTESEPPDGVAYRTKSGQGEAVIWISCIRQ